MRPKASIPVVLITDYTLMLPLSEVLHISFCGFYNVVSGSYSHKIPPGEGVYS